MSGITSIDDDEDLSLRRNLVAEGNAPIHIKHMDPSEANTIRKVEGLAKQIPSQFPTAAAPSLEGLMKQHFSGPTGPSLEARVTRGAPVVPTIAEIESNLSNTLESLKETEARLNVEGEENSPEPHTLDFPHLAWESVKAGLEKERITNDKLNQHIEEAQKLQKDIDLLLDLSAELTAHKEGEKSQKLKDLLTELKGRGIELWKGEDSKLDKEKISELKSLTSAQVDKLRSNLQIIFTTKIQTLIQQIGSIMEILKDIIRNSSKLINKTLELRH